MDKAELSSLPACTKLTPLRYKEQLYSRLQNIEKEIAETLKRLPAHSTKPSVMIDLLAMEDERDLLLKQLEAVER